MHTDELVRMLATGLEPAPTGLARQRWSLALMLSMPIAFALMWWSLGLLPTLSTTVALPMFWIKLALPGVLFVGGLLAATRQARPGARLGLTPWLIGAPLVLIWALAAFTLIDAPPLARRALLYGDSWQVCPFLIAGLSLPTFIATLWAMRGLAPTHLRRAGAAAGLLAGAVGALVYTLHCPELAAPFIGLWYVLGIALPAALGACLGPRLLRW
jgi:hypothetical protein